MFNTSKNNYRSFVLVKISKKDVEAIVKLVEAKNSIKLSAKVKSTIDKTSAKVLKQSE
jgi:hypothetical protein